MSEEGTIYMNYKKKIIDLAKKNNGIVTGTMIKEEVIPYVYLTRMVNEGEIKRVKRGIYTTNEDIIDEYYLLYQKNKKIIFSFISSLYLHNLIDRIPYQMEVTLPNNYNSSHISKEVIIHKVKKENHPVGIIMVKTIFGNEVACYDMERTICDIVRFRDKIDIEIFRKAIMSYKMHPDRNMYNLRNYAKLFKISKKINELIDVI